jgi:hypothetical protein
LGCDLASLPNGSSVIAETKFDIRGVVQLASTEIIKHQTCYPTNVTGIPVAQKCRALQFLLGVGWSEKEGAAIVGLVAHQADGGSHTVDVTYGTDVRNWVFSPQGEAGEKAGGKPAWKGPQKRWQKFWPQWGVRLYKFTWTNPRPDVEITSVDLLSRMTKAAPFVIAITAEP